MTYTHLTPNELVMIEAYFHQETPVAIVAKQLKRGRQTIYNVYNFLKCGGTALEYFEQYKENKRRCGRTEIIFPAEEKEYIEKRSTEGWTPDVIIGRAERTFSCSVSTLYRRFKTGEFNVLHLPMQGKRKPNGYKEKRGKLANQKSYSYFGKHLPKELGEKAIQRVIRLSASTIKVPSSHSLSDFQKPLSP
ncbi:hypothetical protein EfmAA242_07890 [Enterococcus faecium]|nr:hypothetical protein EfmAA242_07890 [Enterococcus faecium]